MTMTATPKRQAFEALSSKWLDPRHVSRRLKEILLMPPNLRVSRVSVERVYPSKLSGLGIEYGLLLRESDGTPHRVKIYLSSREGQSGRASRTLRLDRSGVFGFRGIRATSPLPGFVLHSADRDARLPISTATSPASIATIQTLARRWAGRNLRFKCRCLSYRPARRIVLEYRDTRHADCFLVGKMYPAWKYREVVSAHLTVTKTLCQDAAFRVVVPDIVGTWKDSGMIFYRGIVEQEHAGRFELQSAGAHVLARLHAGRTAGLKSFTIADQLAVTRQWIDLGARLGRGHTAIESLWKWLLQIAADLPPARAYLVHRDFYDRQLIRTSNGWALLDFDTLAAGDRELDLGNFAGHELWNDVKSGQSMPDSAQCVNRLMAAYAAASSNGRRCRIAPLDPVRLAFYLVSTLVRLAVIHGLRTRWASRAPILLVVATAATNSFECRRIPQRRASRTYIARAVAT